VPNIQEQRLIVSRVISKNSISAMTAEVAKILNRLHTLGWGGSSNKYKKKVLAYFFYRLGPGPFGKALVRRS